MREDEGSCRSLSVVCWRGMCGLGSIETDLLNPLDMPKFGQKLGSLEA